MAGRQSSSFWLAAWFPPSDWQLILHVLAGKLFLLTSGWQTILPSGWQETFHLARRLYCHALSGKLFVYLLARMTILDNLWRAGSFSALLAGK